MAWQRTRSAQTSNPYNPPQSGPKCRIWWDSDVQGYQISCPYHPAFLEALKKLIPGSGGMDRTYDPETKQWFISERFFEPTKKLAQAIWPNPGELVVIDRYTTESQQASSAPAQAQLPLEKTCLKFMELIPFEAASAAYRKAAMVLHSDVAGSEHGDKMTRLNVLWDRLKKELYKQ